MVKFTNDKTWFGEGSGIKPRLRPRPYSWQRRLKYVLAMDEKCDAMKDMCAVFYDKVEDCPDIAKTVEEGKAIFEPYGELLAKMNDVQYSYRWYADEDADINGPNDWSNTKKRWA